MSPRHNSIESIFLRKAEHIKEEYIQQQLFRARIASRVAEIRKDPERHPLRESLLKTEFSPINWTGSLLPPARDASFSPMIWGRGITIQGIGFAELLAREAGTEKVLIICPVSLKTQWKNEIRRFSGRDCQIILGSADERPALYNNPIFFTVCNYEQVLRDILSIEPVKWDQIILDEGQRIKNWEAKTTRIVKGLRSPFALVLSGTPLENRLDDLFSIVEFIDDRLLGPAFQFFNRHRITDEKGKVIGYKHLGELRKKLSPFLLRRTRGSVMQELPPRTTECIRITPTDEQMDVHRGQMHIISTIVKKKYLTEMDILRLRKARRERKRRYWPFQTRAI